MKITVACVFVEGHVPFTLDYVHTLKAMVERNLDREHRFVVLTDRPYLFHPNTFNVEIIPKVTEGMYAWWSKLYLFSSQVKSLQSGRCLYLDLDTLVVDSLDEIVDFDAPFALIPDGAPNFQGKDARKTVKRFNSSVMVWDGGKYAGLFEGFRQDVALRLWGDQDWIGQERPNEATFPLHWFPRISECRAGPPQNAKVVLCKKPKNAEAALTIPWVKRVWQ